MSLLKDGTHASFKDAINGPYLLSAKNVKNGKILISTNDRRISTDDFNKIHKTFSLKKHDVLLTIVGSIGQTAILEDTGNFTFQRSVAYLRASEINPYFLKFLLTTYSVQQEIEKRTVISAQPGIYLNDISHLIINFPHHDEEQQKIQKLIHLIEKLTVLYQHQKTTYKRLKDNLVQTMVPVDNHDTALMFFSGFENDWTTEKLSNVIEERNEKSVESYDFRLMSFIQGKGVVPKGERYDRSFLLKDNKKKKYKKTKLNDFIYSSNNLDTGSIGINYYGNALISPVYSIFKSKNHFPIQYLGILSNKKRFIHNMIRFRQGVVYGQWRIKETDFLSNEVLLPGYQQIGEIIHLFNNLEKIIQSLEMKEKQLVRLKTSLMQQMFI